MTTTNKQPTTTATTATTATTSSSQRIPECCMCGDCGLSNELFQCKICQFRSQHRYCSNLYPRAESYRVCNWCLSQDPNEKSQTSSNSSSSNKNNSEEDNSNKPNNNNNNNSSSRFKKKDENQKQGSLLLLKNSNSSSPRGRGSLLQLQINNGPIKKQRSSSSPERSQPSTPTGRRRIISNARLEEKLRRTKSENLISNSNNSNNNKNISSPNGIGITKLVFRNKVRRYKLLDEVSS